MATHTIGEMSTPACARARESAGWVRVEGGVCEGAPPTTGGMKRRVGLRMGSVGHAAMFHGGAFRSYLGNHESTTRKRKSTVKIESVGPSTACVGPIHAVSLAASSIIVV